MDFFALINGFLSFDVKIFQTSWVKIPGAGDWLTEQFMFLFVFEGRERRGLVQEGVRRRGGSSRTRTIPAGESCLVLMFQLRGLQCNSLELCPS